MLDFETDLKKFQEKRDQMYDNIRNSTKKLRQLASSSCMNDSFHIWFDGHFGTINGFRLGRLQSQPVDWNEINAAWGHAVMLLQLIGKTLKYKWTS
jgi:beclin 1